MIWGDLKKGGPLCFEKQKSALVGGYFEKKTLTNKIKKFLYTLEHLIPDGYDEIPTFALYHPLLLNEIINACPPVNKHAAIAAVEQ